jgi:hypothetical protein
MHYEPGIGHDLPVEFGDGDARFRLSTDGQISVATGKSVPKTA